MPRPRELNPIIPGVEAWNQNAKTRAEAVFRDIESLGDAQSIEYSRDVLNEGLAATNRKKAYAEGFISGAKNLSEIRHEKKQGPKIAEGAVAHLKIENDAVIINASDAHGSFEDLLAAIKNFVSRRERREPVYFNYSGDISSGDVEKVIPCVEALAALQARYPNEVTIQFGNGDRRGTSLLMGGAREAVKRFAPDLNTHLEEKTEKLVEQFSRENNITDPKKAKRAFNIFYASELVRLARLGGTSQTSAHQLNPEFLTRMFKTLSGVDKAMGATGQAIKNLRFGVSEPARLWDKKQIDPKEEEYIKKAAEIFEYWKKMDEYLNSQSALTFYETDEAVVVAHHSGYIGENVEKLGDIAFNPREIDRAVWSKLIHPEAGEKPGGVEKYGRGTQEYVSFDPEKQGKILDRFLPKDKKAVLVTGHNHGNLTERIPFRDGTLLRVENCVSRNPGRAGDTASFVEIKLADLTQNPDEPEKAVKFIRTQ